MTYNLKSAAILMLAVAIGTPALAADGDKGTIEGSISVSGVRSPENVLVYLDEVPGDWQPPEKPAHMDQIKLVFTPAVLPIIKGTTVNFLNSDPILHNVFWPKGKGYSTRNLGTWGKGASKNYTFDALGEVALLCNVHAEMEGHIIILQNPFFAVVDKDGAYEIKGVPPGNYVLKTWYSNPKKLRPKKADVTVKAGESTKQDFSLSRRR
jgi:plastocyanin